MKTNKYYLLKGTAIILALLASTFAGAQNSFDTPNNTPCAMSVVLSATSSSECSFTGTATVTPSGNIAPYTYLWSPSGQTDSIAVGLSAGTYSVTVQSNTGCSYHNTVTIGAPSPFSTTATVGQEAIECYPPNGQATAHPTGGGAPYSYTWSTFPVHQHGQTATNLHAGVYTVTVTDTNNCTATAVVTVTAPPSLFANPSVLTNTSTPCSADGSAAANPSGGVTPYTYLWDDANSQTTATANNLSAGTYEVVVHDANNCFATATIAITAPPSAQPNITTTSVSACGNPNSGTATASPTGGASPYTYLWSPNSETTAGITGLSAGTYTLTLTDNNGCNTVQRVAITQAATLFANASVVNEVSCTPNSGKITSAPTGGTMPYTYLWTSSSQTTATVSGLSAGTYAVVVSDHTGCTATASVTITQIAPMVITKDSINPTAGHCNGFASVSVTGGGGSYNYLWKPGNGVYDTIADKCAGTYWCVVTDYNGCKDSVKFNLQHTTGINTINSNAAAIQIYPNPNNGKFTISINPDSYRDEESTMKSVEIYNVLGEKVYTQFNLHNSTFNIDLSNQPDGLYLLRILDKNENPLSEQKVIKTN